MSHEIYAAKQDADGCWSSAIDGATTSPWDYDKEGELFRDARFVPGAGMSMSGSNIMEMFRVIRMPIEKLEDIEALDPQDIATKARERLEDGFGNDGGYWVSRLVQLINVCDVAVSRDLKLAVV